MLFRRILEGELVKKSVTRIRLMNAIFGKTSEDWAEDMHLCEGNNCYQKRDRSGKQQLIRKSRLMEGWNIHCRKTLTPSHYNSQCFSNDLVYRQEDGYGSNNQ